MKNPRPLIAALILALGATDAIAACCYFSAQDRDVDQPGQKAFISWDPGHQQESFIVQPKFEGNAADFGMVIPTPGRPKLDEIPRDFFKHLALYTILLPFPVEIHNPIQSMMPSFSNWDARTAGSAPGMMMKDKASHHGVTVLEAGVVGSLDYKILEAERANGLYDWLKENKYTYSGDAETLDHYLKKKWVFTVMKIDTKQMKKNPDGSFVGEVTPTRFAFASASLVYPLRITQLSVKKHTEALFYVQSPDQMDLKGPLSWTWSYRMMWLMSGTVCISQKQMTPEERQELEERQAFLSRMRQEIQDFDTTKLEWAHRLKASDLALLDDPVKQYGQGGLPDLPEGARVITLQELKDAFLASRGLFAKLAGGVGLTSAKADVKRLDYQYSGTDGVIVAAPDGKRFYWFPNRTAPDKDLEPLRQLKGFLSQGQFITKFRKVFLKHEMKDDLDLLPVAAGKETEYIRILPQSPP